MTETGQVNVKPEPGASSLANPVKKKPSLAYRAGRAYAKFRKSRTAYHLNDTKEGLKTIGRAGKKVYRGAKKAYKVSKPRVKKAYKVAQRVKKYGITKRVSRVAAVNTQRLTREKAPLFGGYTDYGGAGFAATGTRRRVTRQGKPKKKRRTTDNEIRDPFGFYR